MEYISLKDAVLAICSGTGVHVCIHDVSGILKTPGLSVDYLYATHSTKFCDLAKSTESGFERCMRCKNCANRMAIHKKTYFCGRCSYGMFEAVKPVVIDGRTVCIIYIGNMISDAAAAHKKLADACHETGAPIDEMRRLMKKASEVSEDTAHMLCMLLDSYIRMIYEKNKHLNTDSPYHWAVYNIKKYVDENYNRTFTLQEICRLYFVNEKYAGRLFGAQMGMSFHEYLNNLRLAKAAEKLKLTGVSITDAAMTSGFNNVTYFNRLFRKKYGMSPGQYKKLH